jgi:hypothetical protein
MDDLASQIGLYVVLNLVITFSVPNISIGGHLGGLIAGGLIALAYGAAARRGRDGAVLEWGALVVLGVVSIAGALIAAADSVSRGLG